MRPKPPPTRGRAPLCAGLEAFAMLARTLPALPTTPANPPASPERRLPKLRHHHRGQAFVCLSGKTHWLGKWGSQESFQRYDELVSAWLANGRTGPAAAAPPAD